MKKLTLEQRIARLEKVLNGKKSVKNESFETDLDLEGARAAADRIAKQFGRMLGVNVTPDDLGHDVILSPMYGWLTLNDTDEIEEDFIFSKFIEDKIYNIGEPINVSRIRSILGYTGSDPNI